MSVGDAAGDGRNVDPGLGALGGEASGQAAPAARAGASGAPPFAVWGGEPTAAGRAPDDVTYYDRPVIKEPVWEPLIAAYFYLGGLAGAAATLGAVAQVVDREGMRRTVGRCRWLAVGGSVAGTGVLIHDLGRRERFMNMLRVFRPTSPMSVGSWVLALAGGMGTPAALLQGARGRLGALGDLAGLGTGVAGVPLSGYTAVLLNTTVVPVWYATPRSLPPLFVSSAASAAAAALEIAPASPAEERLVHRFGVAAKAIELAATGWVEREAGRIPRVGQPLRRGLSGALWQGAKAATAVSLALAVLPVGRRRPRRLASAILASVGSLAMRFAVFYAGRASARDPRATFAQQRAGHGGAAALGRAAVVGPDGRRAAD